MTASLPLSVLRAYARDVIRIAPSYRNPEYVFAKQIDATGRVVRWVSKVSFLVVVALGILFWSICLKPLFVAGAMWILVSCVWAIAYLPVHIETGISSDIARKHVIYGLIHGLGWMMASTSLLFHGNQQIYVFIACLQITMVAIGFVLYLNLPVGFLAFSMPLASPLIVIFMQAEGRTIIAIPLIVMLLVVMMRIGVDQSRMFAGSVRDREVIHQHEIDSRKSDEAARVALFDRRLTEADDRTHTVALAEERRRAEMFSLGERFRRNVISIVDIQALAISDLTESARHLSELVQRTSFSASDVAHRTNLAAQSINNIAESSGNIAQSIASVDGQLDHHTRLNADVVKLAVDSERRMMVASEEAKHVNGIAEAIAQLARQTRLLALNANIEAARAGAAGNGFTVVANEVKFLAEQAGAETRRATEQLCGIVDSINSAGRGIERTVAGVNNVTTVAMIIAGAVALQRDASSQIRSDTLAMARHVDDVRDRMATVANDTAAADAITQSVSKIVQNLSDQAVGLRQAASSFLGDLANI